MKKSNLLIGITIFLWGTMPPLTKLLLSNLPSMTVLFYSTVIASAALLSTVLISGRWKKVKAYSGRDMLQLLFLGLLGEFLYSAFYYKALTMLSTADASILNYTWPLIAVIFSAPILKEHINLRQIISLIISFIGIIIITSRGNMTFSFSNEFNQGVPLCLLAAGCYGTFNVLNKRKGGDQIVNMTIYFIVTAILSGIGCLFTGQIAYISLGETVGILWLGIFIDAVAFVCWATAIQNNDVSSVVNFSYLTPVVAMFLSAAILKEPVRLYSVLGFVIILFGIMFKHKGGVFQFFRTKR